MVRIVGPIRASDTTSGRQRSPHLRTYMPMTQGRNVLLRAVSNVIIVIARYDNTNDLSTESYCTSIFRTPFYE